MCILVTLQHGSQAHRAWHGQSLLGKFTPYAKQAAFLGFLWRRAAQSRCRMLQAPEYPIRNTGVTSRCSSWLPLVRSMVHALRPPSLWPLSEEWPPSLRLWNILHMWSRDARVEAGALQTECTACRMDVWHPRRPLSGTTTLRSRPHSHHM